jgi:hypothetical protein
VPAVGIQAHCADVQCCSTRAIARSVPVYFNFRNIAFAGVATEIGVLVLTFIDQEVARSRHDKGHASRLDSGDLWQACP